MFDVFFSLSLYIYIYNIGQTVRIRNPNISVLNGYPKPFKIDDPGDDPRR